LTTERRAHLPVAISSIAKGFLIGLPAANVWPLLLTRLGMPAAAAAEVIFLALYIWWARGGGWPKSIQSARQVSFRRTSLSKTEWLWGLVAAICFAISVHAALVVLFRLLPFPVEAFRQDYRGFSVSSPALKWLAIVMSAASAGISEETGVRGYMQQPIEERHGALVAILISSVMFTVIHLGKNWTIPEMVPLVFAIAVLLGLIAWASGSLIPSMIAHTAMDTGMFAYWWTGTLGTFSAKTIAVTGVDGSFEVAVAIAAGALVTTLIAIARLRLLRRPDDVLRMDAPN